MVDIEVTQSVSYTREKSYFKLLRKQKRNKYRKLRRKRKKLNYRRELSCQRLLRKTKGKLESLTVHDYTGMDATDPAFYPPKIKEIDDWHNKHQVAYWKSRAISLEFENRMLLRHIRDMYAKQIEDYALNNENKEILVGGGENNSNLNYERGIEYGRDEVDTDEEVGEEREDEEEEIEDDDRENEKDETDGFLNFETGSSWKPPDEPSGVRKKKEMLEMYGERGTAISGMETALQLNFDLLQERFKPVLWPNIPFNC